MMPTAQSARQRLAQAEAIKEAWWAGHQAPDAATALRENPEIAADRAVAMDLAYEEYCTREDAGERLNSAEFCARFSFGASLRRLLTLHQFLDHHPDALGGVPTNWPAAGESVGDFQIVRELGRGGFSRVYLATESTAGNRPVALKVSAAGSHEADTLGPLSHPHLTQVLSSRRVDPWTTVAMPFAGTATLEDVLSVAWNAGRAVSPRSAEVLLEAATQGGRPDDPSFHSSPDFAVRAKMAYEDGIVVIAAKIFTAVAYLHDKGVAHRDLKPSNVLLGPTGHPYLLDFNLATQITDSWRLAGTLPYMAPEQLALIIDSRTTPPADWRPSDVFACGVILFELLTGRHPFRESSKEPADITQERAARALRSAQQTGPPALSHLNSRIRRDVREAITRCLAIDPNARPTAAELARLFSQIASRRSRWRFVLPTLLVLVAGLSLTYAVFRQPAQSSPPTAPYELGVWWMHKENYSLAIPEFLEAGEKNNDGRAYACAAYCYSKRKNSKTAITAADEAIRLGYREAAVYANRAYDHLMTGHFREAKEDCDETLRLDPNLRAARLTRAAAYLALYQAKPGTLPIQAVEDIDQVLAGTPNNLDVWMLAAHIYVLAANNNPAMLDKAALAVQESVLAGAGPDGIQRNPLLNPALKGNPIYQQALALKPGRVDLKINPHLTSPIP